MLRKISLPEIESGKERRKYEFDFIKLQQRELEKGTSGDKNLFKATDEQLSNAIMLCYDNNWSVDPDDGEVRFIPYMGEDEEGNEGVLFVDVQTMYPGELKEAMKTGLYTHIETYVDGKRGGGVNITNPMQTTIQTIAYRVDGTQDSSPLLTLADIVQHAITYSPTLKGKVKTVEEFFGNYKKFMDGDTSFTSPYYIALIPMSCKRTLRMAIKKDKTSAYSEEYLNTMRDNALLGFSQANSKVDVNLALSEPQAQLAITASEVQNDTSREILAIGVSGDTDTDEPAI